MHKGPLFLSRSLALTTSEFWADEHGKLVVARFLTTTTIGIVLDVVTQWCRKASVSSSKTETVVPRLDLTRSGHVAGVEKFSNYVARQLGFKDETECPELSKLASHFVRSSKGFQDDMYVYFSHEEEVESLCKMLVEELGSCVVAYFAFHWSQASLIIDQLNLCLGRKVLSFGSDGRKLKNMVLAATRGFWSEAITNAVVVETDAFKETDVVYRALSSIGHHNEMLQTSELVHQTSTNAALSLLVTALNEGRDVIMDGTLSSDSFVEQTIAMVRTIHKHRYRMGVGYEILENGTINENYWEKVENEEDEIKLKKPYRIDLVGVVCDTYLAVTRGIRRAIAVKKAVRVNSLLKSHKSFVNAFPKYCHLVDYAKLYRDGVGVVPKVRDYSSHKLETRSKPCVFIGYSTQYKGCQCLDLSTCRIYCKVEP